MTGFVVQTSIHSFNRNVLEFADLWDMVPIVVGDEGTPSDWGREGITFFSLADQRDSDFESPRALPMRHYSRKNFGYLEAIRRGATYIFDTDDDNRPVDRFNSVESFRFFNTVRSKGGWLNIYGYFTDEPIWPRGLPLTSVYDDRPITVLEGIEEKASVVQVLVNHDPDLDAICRELYPGPHIFQEKAGVILGPGIATPFNSQSTFFARESFPLLYIPTTVSFRYADILRSIVAQPIMWNLDFKLGFVAPKVVQERNPHSFESDFQDEVEMHVWSNSVLDLVIKAVEPGQTATEQLRMAYKGLVDQGVCGVGEIETLEAWISDYEKASIERVT